LQALQKVIGMAVRAGMLFAALSLAKTSPHRRPVELLVIGVRYQLFLGNWGQIPIISNYFCDCFGGMKQHEWIADMAVGPTRTLQLCCSERRPSRHGVSTSQPVQTSTKWHGVKIIGV
jgi:hypothetical protein